ncbi:MAG: FkbM family methyltransferase [Flavobacteriales bacterium]|nr:FkbM family methyltransferase [Flavobacteriales bacterium]
MNKRKLKLYTFLETLQLIKYSIGHRIVESVPKGLRKTHNQIDNFYSKDIEITMDKSDIVIEYILNDSPYTFSLCKNSSDSDVFEQIILDKEYQIIYDFFTKNKITVTNIIDAGANIGLTSIFLKASFPEAKIIALEPGPNTFKRLNKNFAINNLKNTITLQKGLWGHKTFLAPDTSFRDKLDWSFSLIESADKTEASIEVISATDIIDEYKLDFIDLFKIDIEGGESSVFSPESDLKWLQKVKVIAIEIHDEVASREEIENTLRSYGFLLSNSGELTIGINKNLLSQTELV